MEPVRIVMARGKRHFAHGARLFAAYAEGLDFDLGFQGFADEMESIERMYGPPGGCLILARGQERFVGCVGVRPFAGDICEMKRLFVIPGQRGRAVGRKLAEAAVARARELGYARMRLDTVASMAAANALYGSLGFRAIPAYRHNPLDGALFYELQL